MTVNGDWTKQSNCAATARPHPLLDGLVTAYIGYDEHLPTVRRRIIPTVAPLMLVDCGSATRRLPREGMQTAAISGSPLFGLIDTYGEMELAGHDLGVAVLFTPPGVRALLGVPPGELAHCWTSTQDLLGHRGSTVPERVFHTRGWPERFAVVDGLLVGRLRSSWSPPDTVTRSWRELENTSGRMRVDTLANRSGTTRRSLEKLFQQHVGCSPKKAARILRFRRAFRLICSGESLALVATAAGYSDQAHLSRDVRELAGVSPGEIRRQARSEHGGQRNGTAHSVKTPA
ncbi:helix-turn-helix domain-containing protein [Streptomyces sp. NPDC049555]|uniref:helix-turn-helix domain-containing protein n=1 Tax=unclassified Streptomyces TaxID=2593676 RepID=UPI00342AD228